MELTPQNLAELAEQQYNLKVEQARESQQYKNIKNLLYKAAMNGENSIGLNYYPDTAVLQALKKEGFIMLDASFMSKTDFRIFFTKRMNHEH